jgi:hypothetical protein
MVMLMLVLGAMARTESGAEEKTPVMVPVLGQLWTEDALREVYDRLRWLYVVDPDSRSIWPVAGTSAGPLTGTVVERSSDRRVIVRGDDGMLVAVQARGLDGWQGERVDMMVGPSGTPKYSYRSRGGKRMTVRQVVEVTLSFREFVTSLQRGYHYPEAPELGTHDGRKGNFRTERIERNKVIDH